MTQSDIELPANALKSPSAHVFPICVLHNPCNRMHTCAESLCPQPMCQRPLRRERVKHGHSNFDLPHHDADASQSRTLWTVATSTPARVSAATSRSTFRVARPPAGPGRRAGDASEGRGPINEHNEMGSISSGHARSITCAEGRIAAKYQRRRV